MGSYLRPQRLEEAVGALADGGYTVLAGGTDFYPARVGRAIDDQVLDITALDELRGIAELGDRYRIGALTTWSDVIAAPLPPMFDGLKLAAREVGGVQIQNAGTLCGNLCNASPAADGVPPLLTLAAEVELSSQAGSRCLPLADFILGNRRTARRPDELVTALYLPKPAGAACSDFVKLGARKYLVISIVMVASLLEHDDAGRITTARLAVGSCAATAHRLSALEEALLGKPLDSGLPSVVTAAHLSPLSPIDDVRGSAEYRMEAAAQLVRRSLERLARQSQTGAAV
ncbi:xanthine dehydrogenase family protein subunit M [Pelagibius litoralis]|uniref:Xanthine dehydrogenase family protein subunit M n=1 Tax=Pelagibius litoralis TaxID=374515 RepID=A0A967EZ11_9PROT|nr:xanthine dehydrogenase family protein subunit M [Pelagibius litoralis]NIA70009.1 xanthine dehydrogenase family protein subunit M [Pelagibius litoralis]